MEICGRFLQKNLGKEIAIYINIDIHEQISKYINIKQRYYRRLALRLRICFFYESLRIWENL